MYKALGIALQATNAPADELERTLMSAIDFAGSQEEVLYIGAYLARNGLPGRALSIFKNVASTDPYRPEPYMQGLKAAKRPRTWRGSSGLVWDCSTNNGPRSSGKLVNPHGALPKRRFVNCVIRIGPPKRSSSRRPANWPCSAMSW